MSAARLRLTPRRRHLAAVITIALSTAFVAVMVLAGNLLSASLTAGVDEQLRGADLMVSGPRAGGPDAPSQPIARPDVPGAVAVWPQVQSYGQVRTPDRTTPAFVQIVLDPPAPAESTELVSGRMPAAPGEVLLDPDTAETLKAAVGGSVSIPAESSLTGHAQTLTVVGIERPSQASALGSGMPKIHVTEASAASVVGEEQLANSPTWFAALPDGADAPALATRLTSDDMTAQTAQQAREDQTEALLKQAAPMGAILGVFVLIALLTSAVVVANTFSVTLAQRVRSLALLRTLGARRGQVARVVLRESLAVGLIGSVLGVVLGHLLVQGALAASAALGWLHGVMLVPVSVLSAVLPPLAGVIVTLLAGIGPIRAATRVAPLQALRPVSELPARGRGLRGALGVRGIIGLIGLLLGLGLMGGGAALSVSGSTPMGVLAAMAGGVISFVAVLIGLVTVTGPLAHVAGAAAGRIGGLPARLAGTATTRSPRRSAATIAALLIGTTLMTMMAVGSRTTEESLTRDLDSRRPVDVMIMAEAMPADATTQIARIPGITAAEQVQRGDIEVGASEPMTLHGASAAQLTAISNRPDLADSLADGTVVLGAERAERFGVHDGQRLSVTAADGSTHPLHVVVDGNLEMSLVTPTTLTQLVGGAVKPEVLARFAAPGSTERGSVDAVAIVTGVQDATATSGWEAATVQAGGAEREAYGQILGVLLGITVGLLAVAVIVALVGVANTLSLSVVERTGENALLRALGTSRRQMRAMLGWEGVLLALIGAVLGIALGTVYGILGILSLLGGGFPVVIAIPWVQLALVLVLAVLAGWAASVLPGRRAARTAPAQALAARD